MTKKYYCDSVGNNCISQYYRTSLSMRDYMYKIRK